MPLVDKVASARAELRAKKVAMFVLVFMVGNEEEGQQVEMVCELEGRKEGRKEVRSG